MINKKLDDIAISDLQELIDNGVNESNTIEYKEFLVTVPDDKTKEFLADVSAFANSNGGDLIFGIPEDKASGLPQSLEGIVITNPDKEVLRLENLIRDGISPKIDGIQIKTFRTEADKYILLIRIQKSWNSPHRVIFKGHDKFYARASNGKYPLDVHQLKHAFLFSDSINEKIKKFRENRISRIISGDTPVPLLNNAKIIMHVVPIGSFASNINQDFSIIKADVRQMMPLGFSAPNTLSPKYNLDGIVVYDRYQQNNNGCDSYAQMYRNGVIETVSADILAASGMNKDILRIWGTGTENYELYILNCVQRYIDLLKKMDTGLPVFIFLTFIGVNGYHIEIYNSTSRISPPITDRDTLIFPEIIIESYSDSVEKQLKFIFDMVWNAFGRERSLNYDSAGNWIG